MSILVRENTSRTDSSGPCPTVPSTWKPLPQITASLLSFPTFLSYCHLSESS